MIAVRDLVKRYGSFTAVDGVSLDVPAGSICGLLGPNGSGKTTTFKCLLGFTRPNAGEIRFDGAPLAPETFERLAFVPERSALYGWLTVEQHVELARRSYARYDGARARDLLRVFDLDPRQKAKRLSKGQQTALALILALAIRPSMLVLDEPATGLDPIFQRVVLDLLIDAAANGASVLLSSHQVGQVERAADRVAILRRGKLVLAGEIDTLKGEEKIVEAIFEGAAPAPNGLARDARVRRVETTGAILRVYARRDAAFIAKELGGLRARNIRVIDRGLEDIFLDAVADGVIPEVRS
jgi:ABC-2 type transport system ATP-binding protein